MCLGRGRGDSIIIALADVRGRKLAPGAGALRSSHDFGFRFTGSGFENAFSPFERPVKPRGRDAVHNSRPDRFLTAQKRALKFARSSNRRIPHVERSAFKGVERGHHLASSDEFSRFFARAPIGRAGRSITQAREKKGFNPKGRLNKRLSRRARALPSAPVSARVARPERRLRRAPENPHRPDPGETPRLERGRGTWRPRCRARCPRTRLR